MPTPLAFIIYKKIIAPKWLIIKCFSNLFVFFTKKFKKTFENIIRDYRFRGYSAEDTINRWPSVRRGEDKWIFPYQENADAMFNSAMLYELAALRKFAEPILAQVPESSKANAEAYRLLRFLRYFNYIPTEELPGTSLLREFLGGGSFKY